MHYLLQHEAAQARSSDFPHAPAGWNEIDSEHQAQQEGLDYSSVHRRVVQALQQYYHHHGEGRINVRELSDALDEAFHSYGGKRYLHQIFPGGPIAQGCRLAGLNAPSGASNPSFGSVQ